jgi:hypothetical protein
MMSMKDYTKSELSVPSIYCLNCLNLLIHLSDMFFHFLVCKLIPYLLNSLPVTTRLRGG